MLFFLCCNFFVLHPTPCRSCQTRSRRPGFCANQRALLTMTFDFHPESETEFLEAIAYYEDCALGMGKDFSLEVYSTVQNILSYSHAWPITVVDPADICWPVNHCHLMTLKSRSINSKFQCARIIDRRDQVLLEDLAFLRKSGSGLAIKEILKEKGDCPHFLSPPFPPEPPLTCTPRSVCTSRPGQRRGGFPLQGPLVFGPQIYRTMTANDGWIIFEE